MKFSSLHKILLSLLIIPASACFSPTEDFCETSDDCSGAAVCNTDTQTCISAIEQAPDAGSDEEEEEEQEEPKVCADRCVQSAPEGWEGPMARTSAAAGEDPQSCGEEFSADLGLANSEIVLDGSCSCSCGDAQGLDCSPAILSEWTASESSCELRLCSSSSGCEEDTQLVFSNSCAVLHSGMFDETVWKATMGTLSGGSCSQPQASGELSSHFGKQDRLCEISQEVTSCGLDSVCAPESPDGFADGLCVMQEGEASCPEGSQYTERTLIFDGIDDQRSCTAQSCSCTSPQGSCGGSVELHDGTVNNFEGEGCNSALATLKGSSSPIQNSNFCQARPAVATTAAYVVNLDGRSCNTGGSAGTAGESTGIGVRTLCCMP